MYKALLAGAVLVFAALGCRLLALKQRWQPRHQCRRLTNSPHFTRLWTAQRTTFLPIRSGAWPMPPVTDTEVSAAHSPESLVRDFDQKYRPNLSPSVAAALRRLDQLRPLLIPILER